MHNYSLRQFGRTVLTITGILLLLIFGSRAASQATSLSAVGGQTKHSVYPTTLTASQLASISGVSAQHNTAGSYEMAVLDATSENQATSQTTENDNGVGEAANQIEQVASQLVGDTKTKVTDTTQPAALDKSKPQQTSLQTDVR